MRCASVLVLLLVLGVTWVCGQTTCPHGWEPNPDNELQCIPMAVCPAPDMYKDQAGFCQYCTDGLEQTPGDQYSCSQPRCPTTQYRTDFGCQDCPPGEQQVPLDEWNCAPIVCPATQYRNGYYCEDCPAGEFHDPADESVCVAVESCPETQVRNPEDLTCADCPAGSHPNTDQTQCTPDTCSVTQYRGEDQLCHDCPAGQVQTDNDEHTCHYPSPCGPLTYRDTSTGQCLDCAAGMKQNPTNEGACVWICDGVSHRRASDQQCEACGSNMQQNPSDEYTCVCKPNYEPGPETGCVRIPCGSLQYLDSVTDQCMDCANGMEGDPAQPTQCRETCAPGYSRNEADVCVMDPCPDGQVRNPADAAVCVPDSCPWTQFFDTTSYSCQDCYANEQQDPADKTLCMYIPCTDDQYLDVQTGACAPCPEGTRQNPDGKLTCRPACSSTQYRDETGVCVDCPSGHEQDPDYEDRCVLITCSATQYRDPEDNICKECAEGTRPRVGGDSCVPLVCSPSQFRQTDDRCYECPDEYSQHPHDASTCALTTCGAFARRRASDYGCEMCGAGMIQDPDDEFSCTSQPVCTQTQYRNQTDATCHDCPAGQVQRSTTEYACEYAISCSATQYIRPSDLTCQDCPAGQMVDTYDQTRCILIPCQANQYRGEDQQCHQCPDGQLVHPRDQTRCAPITCPTHQYRDSDELCQDCPTGQQQWANDERMCVDIPCPSSQKRSGSTCVDCPIGESQAPYSEYHCERTPCNATEYRSFDDQLCHACPENYFRDPTSEYRCDTNVQCPSTQYKRAADNFCVDCPAGQQQDPTNQRQCVVVSLDCTETQYRDQGTCVECPEGTRQNYQGEEGSCVPLSCPSTQYRVLATGGACLDCPAFVSKQNPVDEWSCVPICDPEFHRRHTDQQCEWCGAGMEQDPADEYECRATVCSSSQYRERENLACYPCPTGQHQDPADEFACVSDPTPPTSCPTGQYGAYCEAVCTCGVNQICDDGLTGTGRCRCSTGYVNATGVDGGDAGDGECRIPWTPPPPADNSTETQSLELGFNIDPAGIGDVDAFQKSVVEEIQTIAGDPLLPVQVNSVRFNAAQHSVSVNVTVGLTAAQVLQQFASLYSDVPPDPNVYPLFSRMAYVVVPSVTSASDTDVPYATHWDATCGGGCSSLAPVDFPAQCYNGICGCTPTETGECERLSLPVYIPPDVVCVSGASRPGVEQAPDICQLYSNTANRLNYRHTNYTLEMQPQMVEVGPDEFRELLLPTPTGTANHTDECTYRNPRAVNLFPRRRYCQNLDHSYPEQSYFYAVFGDAFTNLTNSTLLQFGVATHLPQAWSLTKLPPGTRSNDTISIEAYVRVTHGRVDNDTAERVLGQVWSHIEYSHLLARDTIQLRRLTFLDAIEGAHDRYYFNGSWHWYDCGAMNQAYVYLDEETLSPRCDCRSNYRLLPGSQICVPSCANGKTGLDCDVEMSVECSQRINNHTAFVRSDEPCGIVCLSGYVFVGGSCQPEPERPYPPPYVPPTSPPWSAPSKHLSTTGVVIVVLSSVLGTTGLAVTIGWIRACMLARKAARVVAQV